MCAIFGSSNLDKFKSLYELNLYRGNHSCSIAIVKNNKFYLISQKLGKMDFSVISRLEYDYIIGHSQAPTNSEVSNTSIHPAEVSNNFLYHNGIIKSSECDKLRLKYNTDEKWDTKLFLREILNNIYDVNGSFACLLIASDNKISIFRNQLSNLFVDNKLNISSTKFDNAKLIDPGVVYSVNFDLKIIEPKGGFKTKENPYYFS